MCASHRRLSTSTGVYSIRTIVNLARSSSRLSRRAISEDTTLTMTTTSFSAVRLANRFCPSLPADSSLYLLQLPDPGNRNPPPRATSQANFKLNGRRIVQRRANSRNHARSPAPRKPKLLPTFTRRALEDPTPLRATRPMLSGSTTKFENSSSTK